MATRCAENAFSQKVRLHSQESFRISLSYYHDYYYHHLLIWKMPRNVDRLNSLLVNPALMSAHLSNDSLTAAGQHPGES